MYPWHRHLGEPFELIGGPLDGMTGELAPSYGEFFNEKLDALGMRGPCVYTWTGLRSSTGRWTFYIKGLEVPTV